MGGGEKRELVSPREALHTQVSRHSSLIKTPMRPRVVKLRPGIWRGSDADRSAVLAAAGEQSETRPANEWLSVDAASALPNAFPSPHAT